ncbi:MAG: alkaline phosphatase family protein [Thermoanaerobaculia bacterium]
MKKALFSLLFLATVALPLPLAAADRPDLVVVISIDQFRYEYVQRFAPYFGKDGFNRFLIHGATFENARYPYAITYTGPGHAAIGTGRDPAHSGIVSNDWWDRREEHNEYCVEDDRTVPTAPGVEPVSPLNLASDSLGDRLEEHDRGAKVIGISIKDRAAILMAGRKATAAYWFDPKLPGFVSTNYYKWDPGVLAFNEKVPEFVASHSVWDLSGLLTTEQLDKLTFDPPNLRQYKSDRAGLGRSFPHPIGSANALLYTPFGNDLLFAFARHVIDAERLGTHDDEPDILWIGLSPQDYLGHAFGPDSMEVADSVMRIDASLATFLDWLDTRFPGRVTVALTADHGVQSIPEVAKARGKDAGRVSLRNPGKNAKTFRDLPPLRHDLERRIAGTLRIKVTDSTPLSQAIVLRFEEPSIYINWKRVASLHFDPEYIRKVVRNAVLEINGVSHAYTATELMLPTPTDDPILTAVRRSFRADRSGDVLITLKEGTIWSYDPPTGTTHGQPVEADQHVPLMFWGFGIREGVYDDAVSPLDLASTLGSILGVEAGTPGAKPLPCVEKTTGAVK